jgi:hypothetical protein
MRRPIYWLLPDRHSARLSMDDLLLARIENRHIHFLARLSQLTVALLGFRCFD